MSPRWVWLYPRSWRSRYGEEFVDDLTRTPSTLRTIGDLVRGAIDARVHRSLLAGGHTGPKYAPPSRRWALTPVVALSLAGALLAGVGLQGHVGRSGLVPVSVPLSGVAPVVPRSSAPLATWVTFAVRQTAWIEGQPYRQLDARKGLTTVKLWFIPVTRTPGAPPGVTTTAAAVIVAPAKRALS